MQSPPWISTGAIEINPIDNDIGTVHQLASIADNVGHCGHIARLIPAQSVIRAYLMQCIDERNLNHDAKWTNSLASRIRAMLKDRIAAE